MPDDQPVGGGRGNARIPGIHERAQQAEGQHRHGDADNGQQRAQRVPKGIPVEEFPQHR